MSTVPTSRSVTTQLPLPLAGEGGVDVHALSAPARHFTGDFYFSHRTGDTLWLVVGDVAGKGLSAAVVMAMIQEELEHRVISCARTGCDPANTLQRLHDTLRPVLPPNRFATVIVAQIRDDGRLLVANGGHPPALISRHDGSVEQIGSTGPPAGILDGASWRSVRRTLAPGETLLLYTDGVIEANDFGVPRLTDAFREAARLPNAREVARGVAHAVREHGGIDDDLTLLAARR